MWMVWIWGFIQLEIHTTATWNLADFEVYRCRTLAATDDGTVALIDRDAGQVVLLSQGVLIRRFGTSGQGPGEFQAPVEIGWSRADQTFAVVDFGNGRLSKWSREGSLVDEVPLTFNGFFPQFAGADRLFFVVNFAGLNNTVPTLKRFQLKSGEDTEIYQHHRTEQYRFSTGENGGNRFQIVYRWDPRLVFGAGSEFLAIAFGDRPELLFTDHNGKSLGPPIRLQLPRYPVTDAQMEAGVQLMPPNLHASLRRGLHPPPGWPFIRAVLVDAEDRIWVVGSARDVGAAHAMVVLNRKGKVLGRGEIDGVPLAATAKGLFYLSEHGDDLLLSQAIHPLQE